MAVLATSALTLLDHAKRRDPDGKIAKIVELLSEQNDLLKDMAFMEGNLPTGHRTTVRTGLPTVYWRKLNQGIAPSKSATAQIDEQCGIMEAWSEVDKDLAELEANLGAFRLSESAAFLESMNQEAAETFFYGNDVDGSGVSSAEFNGLSIRYSDNSAANGENMINMAGTDADSSIWLVGHGAQAIHGIFPKGSKAGLQHTDMGLVTIEDRSTSVGGSTEGIGGGRMRVYQDHFQWKMGLVVKDWRYAVRIANVDLNDELSGNDLIQAMVKATHLLPNLSAVKPVFYMNRSVFHVLDIQRMVQIGDGSNWSNFTYENIDGKVIPNFRGIPIRICDALSVDETDITFV